MGKLLSNLSKEYHLDDKLEFVNEREFDYFARATTIVEGKKCIFLAKKKYLKSVDTSVSMIITNNEIAHDMQDFHAGICISNNPRGLYFELLSCTDRDRLLKKKEKSKIGKGTKIASTAIIDEYNVVIGDNVTIGDFVVIHGNTIIGDNTTIQTGAKIGEQDFNVYSFEGKTKQVFHGGQVVIGSNVLISPGVLIGQALYSYGKTVIGDNCYIGANTCIGHNAHIEESCEICGNSILGGYAIVGKGSTLFMNVTVANATTIGENVTANMGSVIIRDVPSLKTVFGNPAKAIISPR